MGILLLVLRVIAAITLAAGVGVLLYFYISYLKSPWYLLHQRGQQARGVLEDCRRQLRFLEKEYRRQQEEQSQRFFAQALARTPVDILQRYPGIGDKTVARLRQAGWNTLRELTPQRLSVLTDLGRRRLEDLQRALVQAQQDLRQQFERGGLPEGLEWQQVCQRLDMKHKQAAQEWRQKEHACQQYLSWLKKQYCDLSQTTFWHYLWARWCGQPFPASFAEAPDIPTLEDWLAHPSGPPAPVKPAAPPRSTSPPVQDSKPLADWFQKQLRSPTAKESAVSPPPQPEKPRTPGPVASSEPQAPPAASPTSPPASNPEAPAPLRHNPLLDEALGS
jgi:hypothetical protein